MSRQHLSWRHLSTSGVSQLLLTRFGPNFKGRFLGQSLTDVNFQGDICPYKQYLSYYWPDFDENFWNQFWELNFCTPHFFGLKFLLGPLFLLSLSIGQISFVLTFFGPKILLGHNIFLDHKFFLDESFWTQIFLD